MTWLWGWLLVSVIFVVTFLLASAFAADPEDDPVNELDGIPPLILRRRGVS